MIARLEREGALDEPAASQAFERLKQLAGAWHEVDASDAVGEAAVRFLRVHPLRAADALQLAAAFVAAERRPASLEMMTLDDRLAVAARKEGFVLIEANDRMTSRLLCLSCHERQRGIRRPLRQGAIVDGNIVHAEQRQDKGRTTGRYGAATIGNHPVLLH